MSKYVIGFDPFELGESNSRIANFMIMKKTLILHKVLFPGLIKEWTNLNFRTTTVEDMMAPGAEGHTKGPWHWAVLDKSMAVLHGKDMEEDHIMSVSPCESCMEGKDMMDWKWGRCTTPNEADAELIRRAPELLEENDKLKREVKFLNDEISELKNRLASSRILHEASRGGLHEAQHQIAKLQTELNELQKENDYMSTDSKHQEQIIRDTEGRNWSLQKTLQKMMSAMQKDVNRLAQRANEYRIALEKRNKRIAQYRELLDYLIKGQRLSKKEHSEFIK